LARQTANGALHTCLDWNRSHPTIETAAARRLSRTPSTAKRQGSNSLCIRDLLPAPACMLDSSGRGWPHTPTPPPVAHICVGGLCGEARRARWECQQGLVSRASVRRGTANARGGEAQRSSGRRHMPSSGRGSQPPLGAARASGDWASGARRARQRPTLAVQAPPARGSGWDTPLSGEVAAPRRPQLGRGKGIKGWRVEPATPTAVVTTRRFFYLDRCYRQASALSSGLSPSC